MNMTEQIYLKKQLSSNGHRFSNESWANDLITVDITAETDEVAQHGTGTPIANYYPVDQSSAQTEAPGMIFIDLKNIKEVITIKGSLTGQGALATKNKIIAIQQVGGTLDEFKWRDEVFNATNQNVCYLSDYDFKDKETEGTTNLLDSEVRYDFTLTISVLGRVVND